MMPHNRDVRAGTEMLADGAARSAKPFKPLIGALCERRQFDYD